MKSSPKQKNVYAVFVFMLVCEYSWLKLTLVLYIQCQFKPNFHSPSLISSRRRPSSMIRLSKWATSLWYINCPTTHLAYRRLGLTASYQDRFRFGDRDVLNRRFCVAKYQVKCAAMYLAIEKCVYTISGTGASRNIRVGCCCSAFQMYICYSICICTDEWAACGCSLIIPTKLETMTWCSVQDAMFMLGGQWIVNEMRPAAKTI